MLASCQVSGSAAQQQLRAAVTVELELARETPPTKSQKNE